MSRRELDRVSAGELGDVIAEWRKREEAEQDRELAMDWRFGQLCSLLANVHRNPDKAPWPYHPADFFGSLERFRPPPPTDDEMTAKLNALAGVKP